MREADTTKLGGLATGLIVVIALAAANHLLFSWMGFNPTDEGFYLAAARRVADGQVPHHDFLSIRPMGAALLYAPIAHWGGDSVFWIARFFVWLEHAAIAWLWVDIVDRAFGRPLTLGTRIALVVAAFALAVARYPIYVTTTVEALFVSTVGIAVRSTADERNGYRRLIAYAIMGFAPVCRQNFLLIGPIAIIVYGDWSRVRYWIAWAAPIAGYVAWVAESGPGSVQAMFEQLHGYTALVHYGVVTYVQRPELWAGILVALATIVGRRQAALGPIMLATCLVAFGLNGRLLVPMYVLMPFAVFGAALVVAAELAYRKQRDRAAVAIMALACAWSASISLGLNAPVLGVGMLLALVVVWSGPARSRAVIIGLAAAVAVVFLNARRGRITVDGPARELACAVPSTFPGARHLRTDPTTCRLLEDMPRAVALAGSRRYALLPDFAAYWVAAPFANPLPMDWPWDAELTTDHARARVIAALDSQRGQVAAVVCRVQVARIEYYGIQPVGPGYSTPADYVRAHWTLVGRTAFFDVYE
ncbi:MAG TPA: hypothetical protein VNW46_09395 [Gemmatimonadaceae bacterium]|nr:hypothetical protein [Gemmatimonadaceae bacterium]